MLHSPPARRPAPLAAHLLCLFLAACGGGGGSAGASAPPPPSEPTNLPSVDVSTVAPGNTTSALPSGWQQGAFAQIFVRSYQDSDGDGIGDLRGLTQRLDYLKELGVTGIWLMPVTQSQDHDHGYAVADYRNTETRYGSLADFDKLLSEAHARGIGVIVDYVMNHSAAEHPLFVNAKSASSNAYRDWYIWQGLKPGGWSIYGNDPWRGTTGNYYFAPFWDQMPDFNLLNPKVPAWHHDNLRFWMNRGVDGFRVDAVGNLVENGPSAWENQPQNYTLLRSVRQMMNTYAERFLVCEGPSDPSGYTSACGSAFAFNNSANLVAAAKGDAAAVARVAAYHQSAPSSISTMLSNHDSFAGQRAYDQFGGNLAQYKLAAATYLLQPGTPFIYYGEEIGLAGASSIGGDPKLRTPMSWTSNTANAGFTSGTPYRALSANVATFNVAAQSADPTSLLSHYKAMLALRNTLPAIRAGSYEAVAPVGATLSFQRKLGTERVVVAINYGLSSATLALGSLPAGAVLASAFPAGAADVGVDANGQASLTLPAQTVRVLTLK
jgi:alpha-amylase